jgi:parvulin-like peptidyl-prolyl isomerase
MRIATAAVALVACVGLAACGSGGDASLGPAGDTAVQVGTAKVTNGEVERRAVFLATVPDQSTGQPAKPPAKDSKDFADFRRQAAAQLLDERVFGILAARCGTPCLVTDKEIDKQVTDLRNGQFGKSDAALQKALTDRGITLADYKASLRSSAEELKLQKKIQDGVTYTDAEARAYYEKNLAQYKLAAERRLSFILLGSKAAADQLRSQLTAGNFAATAKAKSLDPAAKTTGGDLGPVNGGGLLPELAAAAGTLKPGEISKPVQTQFGWSLLLVREIKARTRTFDEVRADIRRQQLQVKQAAAVQKWRDTVFKKQKDAAKYVNPKVAPPKPATTTTSTTSKGVSTTTSTGTGATTTGKGTSTGATGPATP